MDTPWVQAVWREINDLKRAGLITNYAIGGAVGAMFYTEPIDTSDLDVFVALPPSSSPLLTLTPVYAHLAARGHHPEREHVRIHGMLVQFLGAESLAEEAVEHAVERKVGGEAVRVMTPEYLLALMVKLNRAKDRVRIDLFIRDVPFDAAVLGDILKRHGLTGRWSSIRRLIDG